MKKFLTTLLATLAVILIGGVTRVSALGQNDPQPYFNYYNNVPNIGSEADFVRVSKVGANDFSNNVEACTDGQEVTVRVYIHNVAEPEFNGTNNDGPGVTKNAKVALDVANSTNPGTIKGTLTADNAANSGISDTATVTCNGQVMDMTYVAGSAVIKNTLQNYVGLSDNIFKGGTPYGYTGQDGKQPGCWEYVTYVYAKVVVKKKPVVIPSSAICKLENGAFAIIDKDKRIVRGSIKPQLTNATVVSNSINWGDGTTSTKQSDTHTYAKDGQYNIQASFVAQLNDGSKQTISGAECATVVKFQAGQPPVVVTPTTPTHLAKTGPANILSVFAVTSVIGAVLHRIYTARKARQEV